MSEEPTCYQEATTEACWYEAMEEELETIKMNKTWTLTELPLGHKPIGLKWVYKLKKDSAGKVVKYKARLVAKGYVQRQGIDFEEGIEAGRLFKALYGLRQAPRAWNMRLNRSLVELDFKKYIQEHAVYTRGEGEASILVGVYVDDLIVTGGSTEKINKFKQQMMTEFEMSDLGLSYYLGIEVEQQKSRISLRQSAYAKKILSQFKMADCNATKHPMEPKTQLHKDLEGTPVDTTEYRCIVGCLRYLLHTWPDLSYSVGMESRYMERPTIMHHRVVKQILRYLKGTIYFGLVYIKGPQEIDIFGYSDSDLADDLDGRKSTSGMTFYFNESLVSWNSQKQKTVALSSCEAEFMAATTAACHALWLRSLASELTGVKPKPVTLFVDNKSAIALMKNPGQIVVEFVNTGEQRADALTKALPGVKLAAMRQLLSVRDLQSCQD
ncbi:uncharacterized mitochondrial protein AtMg00810-like [Zingiber officinale]|uniref:uncharacterized mitochondrial protein AtMg00810-like n=1 Tax=Zingiber officinale TaxID=94328 RepID=UPI001C4B52DF|nr:uncharacterized mitochondrial protein AtMg00810-like [Zingiber officinale]